MEEDGFQLVKSKKSKQKKSKDTIARPIERCQEPFSQKDKEDFVK